MPLSKMATLAACIVGLPIAADMVLNIVIPKNVIDWPLYLVTPIVVVIFVANFIGVAGMSILPIDLACHTPRSQGPKSMSRWLRRWN